MVWRNPKLRIRVVTGNTLTAAVVIKRLPKHVHEVFLVGSSDVSRAIALHLSTRGVRVLVRDGCLQRKSIVYLKTHICRYLLRHENISISMLTKILTYDLELCEATANRFLSSVCRIEEQALTQSRRCFEKIQSELPHGNQQFLVNVTKFQAGQRCSVNSSLASFYPLNTTFALEFFNQYWSSMVLAQLQYVSCREIISSMVTYCMNLKRHL